MNAHRNPPSRLAGAWAALSLLLILALLLAACQPAPAPAPTEAAAPTIPPPVPTLTRQAGTAVHTQASPLPPTELPPSPSPVESTIDPLAGWLAEFSAYLDGLAAADQFSGAALVARENQPLWQAAYGLADRSRNLPNTLETRFNLGSMNKMFTAVAILQLVEQGKLSLDDRIRDLLPDYPNRQVAEAVTVEQLLTHTAGMGDCFTGEFFTTPAEQLKTVQGYLPLFADKPLQFKPGTQYAYSNEGYMVLGLIIEKISGKSYFDFMRENIYTPSGMASTGEFLLDAGEPDLAIGYTTKDAEGNQTGNLAANTALMPVKGTPAGGGYSTVGDLLRFRDALLGHRLLDPATTADLLKGRVAMRENVSYAYGFLDKVIAGQRVVGHGGNAPGVCDLMDMYPELGYTLIVLSNSDDGCLLVRDYLNENPMR